MTIRYKNTFRDIMAFCLHHYTRSPIMMASVIIIMAIFSNIFFKELSKDGMSIRTIIIFLMCDGFVFVVILALYAVLIVISMISRRNKTLYSEKTFQLSEGGFVTETEHDRAEQKWSIVQKLSRNRKYIFIYVSQHAAHVVPRRAFQSTNEWDAFYEFFRQKTNVR